MTAVLSPIPVMGMPPTKRNHPRRSTPSESRYTIFEFSREFPGDAACLDYLVDKLYPDGIYCPKCQKVTKQPSGEEPPLVRLPVLWPP